MMSLHRLRRIEHIAALLHRYARPASDDALSPYAQCVAGEVESLLGMVGKAIADEEEAIEQEPIHATARRWELTHAEAA